MKASEFIKELQSAIDKHGDLDLVVGYDSAHADVEAGFDDSVESWDGGSDTVGPRNLVLDCKRDENGDNSLTRVFRI